MVQIRIGHGVPTWVAETDMPPLVPDGTPCSVPFYFIFAISALTSAVTSLLSVSLIYGMPLALSMMYT